MIDQCVIGAQPGAPSGTLPILGMAYADGLFETMRCHRGAVPWWPIHRDRMDRSLRRLALDRPDWERLEQKLEAYAQAYPESVFKLICYSADASRGYRRTNSESVAVLQVHILPPAQSQISACTAEIRLDCVGSLAGLKTLARLQQRMAATTAAALGADVALLRNRDGHAVSFSHGNLVLDYGGALWTPPLTQGAIAGVVRLQLLARQPVAVKVRPIPYDWLCGADAIVLTNAVRGVQAVTKLDGRSVNTNATVGKLQTWLASLGLPQI